MSVMEDIRREIEQLTNRKEPRPLRDINLTRTRPTPISPESEETGDSEAGSEG
jgi:hypothetical protein